MLGKELLNIKSDTLLERLNEFEQSCLGIKTISPERYMDINKELAMGAVLYIGRHRMGRAEDGDHLIWTDPEKRVHDLGPVDNLDVLHECPGFHRTRTLAIGQHEVVRTEVIDIPPFRKQMTKVFLKDGSEGVGPDFKIALRNAALKKHLKTQFNKAKGFSFWELFAGGNA
jgi:hypothetical protein